MQYFFVPPFEGNQLVLPESESRHASRSLRKQVGDVIWAIDGQGGIYQAEITRINSNEVVANVLHKQVERPKLWSPWLLISPPKKADRVEWIVEKCTELGVERITFVQSQRTERNKVNVGRLQKIAISASKQSGRSHLPQIDGLTPLPTVITDQHLPQTRFIAHCSDLPKTNFPSIIVGTKAVFMIGPEGDFTETEIELARAANFRGISLGEFRLRTETAAMYVTSIIHFVNQSEI